MSENYLRISIPVELKQYQKLDNTIDDNTITADFGVKIVKDSNGDMQYAAYYSDSGDIIKKIFYKGSSVANIKHYRDNTLTYQECFNNGRLKRKITYDKSGKAKADIVYEYNSKNLIVAIRKNSDNNRYEVEYGYDELSRVDSRIIKYNSKICLQQMYRYDILDRVVEYRDRNQHIKVQKINPKNELLAYTITDRAGNDIIIINKYLCSDYIGTEIDLNGHKTTVKDKAYVDNVMLKHPFTSEDDLDLVFSNIINTPSELSGTKRDKETDISECIISNEVKEVKNLVINGQIIKPLSLDTD